MYFLNSSIYEKTPNQFKNLHIAFILFWVTGLIIFFRIDSTILEYYNVNLKRFEFLFPILYLTAFFRFFRKIKILLFICFLIYPILLFFWFIPKQVLRRGKVYLLISYFKLLIKGLANWKRNLIFLGALLIFVILFLFTNSTLLGISSILIFGYLYVRYLYTFLESCFQTEELVDSNRLQKYLDENEKSPFIEEIENKNYEEKITKEEAHAARLKRLVNYGFVLNYCTTNLNGFRGKRAYLIYWFSKLAFYTIITLFFFTFLNFELYKIQHSNFVVLGTPNIFDFFYYTLKTLSFTNIDGIKPISILSKCSEMFSFFNLSIILITVVTSFIFPLVREKNSNEINILIRACEIQNKLIESHIRTKYETNINKAVNEIQTIKESVDKLKAILTTII